MVVDRERLREEDSLERGRKYGSLAVLHHACLLVLVFALSPAP